MVYLYKAKAIQGIGIMLAMLAFVLPQGVHAAEIPHTFVEVTASQSSSGWNTYSDVAGAEIAAGSFEAGKKYLIVATAQLTGGQFVFGSMTYDVHVRTGIKAVHGSTDFADSEALIFPDAVGKDAAYFWFTVWTAQDGEAVKLQLRDNSFFADATADQITLFAMEVSEELTEDTDWFYDENTSDADLTALWTASGNASVSFTPKTAGENWLVLGSAQYTNVDWNDQTMTRIHRTGEAEDTHPQISQESNNPFRDVMVHTPVKVYNLGSASNTFAVESQQDEVDGVVGTRTNSKVFAMNLNKFRNVEMDYKLEETKVSPTAWGTEVNSASITPAVAGDVWALSWFVGDYVYDFKYRMQVDNTDEPATQTADAYRFFHWDSTDELGFGMQTVERLSAESHVVDVDAYYSTIQGAVEDRQLVLVSMELAP